MYIRTTALLWMVALLSVGCAGTGSHTLSELVTDNHSLVVVSLSRTYKFQNATGQVPPYLAIDAFDKRNETKGRIVSGHGLSLSPREGETWRVTQVLRLDGSNYLGELNLIRVPAGHYSLREWIVPENKRHDLGAFGKFFLSNDEKRGLLDTAFAVPPNAILYLGGVHLDEGVVVTKADCRQRDINILNTVFPEARSRPIHYEPLGNAECPR